MTLLDTRKILLHIEKNSLRIYIMKCFQCKKFQYDKCEWLQGSSVVTSKQVQVFLCYYWFLLIAFIAWISFCPFHVLYIFEIDESFQFYDMFLWYFVLEKTLASRTSHSLRTVLLKRNYRLTKSTLWTFETQITAMGSGRCLLMMVIVWHQCQC